MTIWYVYYSQDSGAITRIASLPQIMLPEEAAIECQDINPADVLLTQCVENGVLVAKPQEPPNYDDAVNVAIPQRNQLLYASDWTQIPNNPLTAEQQQAWAVYRQELRDITIQAGYPFNIIWPVQPE
jgi:hypothetical protein